MAEGEIKVKMTVDGAAESAQALKSVAGATREAGAAAEQGSVKVQQLGSSMGLVSNSIGAINPQLGQLGSTLAAGTSQFGAMSQSAGVLGGAIAALATGFALFTRAVSQAETAIKNAQKAAEDAAPSFERSLSLVREQNAQMELARRLASGAASTEEYQAQTRTLQQQRADLIAAAGGDIDAIRRFRGSGHGGFGHQETGIRGVLADALDFFGADSSVVSRTRVDSLDADEQRRLEGMVQRLTRQLDTTTQQEVGSAYRELGTAIDQGEIARRRRERNGRGGGGGGNARRDREQMQAAMDDKFFDSMNMELNPANTNDVKQDSAVTAADRAARAEQQMRQRTLAQEREWYSERRRQRDAFYDSWAEKGEKVGAALGDVLNLVASGQATFLQAAEQVFKQFLQQTAKSESIEAGKAFAKALGAAFVHPEAAGGFVAEGVAHLAVAAAAGGAQVIVGNHGSSGAARPTRVASPSSGLNGGGGTVVVNMNAPVVTAGTTRELGRTLDRVTRAGQQRFGEAA